MTAPELIQHYGYGAIVVGTFFEGELIMLAAGVAACAGLLSLPWVVVAGMAGIFLSDTCCFLIGRFAGEKIKSWFPRMHARLGPVFRLIERYDEMLVVFFQFFPGLCAVTPMAFGMSEISAPRFMLLDLAGNALWTTVFSLGGYIFGAAFERMVGESHGWWPFVAAAVIAIGLVLWRVAQAANRRAEQKQRAEYHGPGLPCR